ncbi:TerD domain-containing protein [Streptomyces sp. PTM05]|uniref:TerD domain-containing protein n=1 Tax=Streptantibioticus parmotrematis TaxID=2873249 RepID=A0ABS7QR29_9ACTN|nr:TerD family protein [Streptantibioticus parmotrematis]MBY8885643.1 TerD domain-containing protein [Streptantibioticus parmotrematis]
MNATNSMNKGANTPVTASGVRVEVGRAAGPGVPEAQATALLLSDGRVRHDGDVVQRHRPVHASGAVRHEGDRTEGGSVVDVLAVDLGGVEPGVERIVLAATSDGGSFAGVPGLYVRLTDAAGGTEIARYDSVDATVETALVLGELYRRNGQWKFRAVGQGYANGLAGLGEQFGVAPDAVRPTAPAAAPAPPAPAPAAPVRPAPRAAPVRLSKVTLTKDAPSVSLTKQGGISGVMRVNLSWQAAPARGWLRKPGAGGSDVDLDLCALFELRDGTRGVVQALGNAFGTLDRPPYIHLDGDDRTGGTSGENLTVNLDHSAAFRRILIFVTVYEGARSFAGLHATTTLTPQNGAPVEFFLDECTVPSTVCALALITNEGGELVVRREARYLVPARGVSPQRTVDQAYGWGMRWTPGRK